MPTQRTPPRTTQGDSSLNANVTQRVTRSNAPATSNTNPVQHEPALATVDSAVNMNATRSPSPVLYPAAVPLDRTHSMQSTLDRNRDLEAQLAQEQSTVLLLRRQYADQFRLLQDNVDNASPHPARPINPSYQGIHQPPASQHNPRSLQDVRYQAQPPIQSYSLQGRPTSPQPLNYRSPLTAPLQPSAFTPYPEPYASRARSLRPEPFTRTPYGGNNQGIYKQ